MKWSAVIEAGAFTGFLSLGFYCFKGHRTTLFISSHFFVTLIASTFLTTLSDNSALELKIQRSIHSLFTAIKITKTSLWNTEGQS